MQETNVAAQNALRIQDGHPVLKKGPLGGATPKKKMSARDRHNKKCIKLSTRRRHQKSPQGGATRGLP